MYPLIKTPSNPERWVPFLLWSYKWKTGSQGPGVCQAPARTSGARRPPSCASERQRSVAAGCPVSRGGPSGCFAAHFILQTFPFSWNSRIAAHSVNNL